MRGGLNLQTHKERSDAMHIVAASMPQRVYLPLNQHAGGAVRSVVAIGDSVLRGQAIATASDALGASLHASVSGTVIAIESQRTPQNLKQNTPVIVLENDGLDRCDPSVRAIDRPFELPPLELRHAIARGGIVGLGGAMFPTATKLDIGAERKVQTLVINGAECEPHIVCDDALMRERAADVVYGMQLLLHATGAHTAIIVIEDNKLAAGNAIRQALLAASDHRLQFTPVTTRYPIGGERQLIQALVGKEVPSNALPADIGVLCQNVATAAAIAKLIRTGEPLLSRIVTLTGSGIREPRNLEARIGTMLASLIADCGGYIDDPKQIIAGGSMMGVALPNDAMPIVKSSNCVIVATARDFNPRSPELPCIRCGDCANVCPAGLLPQELLRYARNENHAALKTLGLSDCIECGCCDYVCPSQIPLTATFVASKESIANVQYRS